MISLAKKRGTAWGFKTILHILKGWGRRFGLVATPDCIQAIALERNRICEKNEGICSKQLGLLKVINGDIQKVDSLVCTKCHCPCLEKALVKEETCPLNKWPKV